MIEQLHCLPEDMISQPDGYSARSQIIRAIAVHNLQLTVKAERDRRQRATSNASEEVTQMPQLEQPERVESHSATSLVSSEEEEAQQDGDQQTEPANPTGGLATPVDSGPQETVLARADDPGQSVQIVNTSEPRLW